MNTDFDFEEDEQLDMFCFMDETERDKDLYEVPTDTEIQDSVSLTDLINSLCKTCENCQYKSITKHTKELRCTMFDCDMHRSFSECRGHSKK